MTNLRSHLRDDFRSDSDIDLLVDFAPRANLGLLDFIRLENELSALLGRPVDLVEAVVLSICLLVCLALPIFWQLRKSPKKQKSIHHSGSSHQGKMALKTQTSLLKLAIA